MSISLCVDDASAETHHPYVRCDVQDLRARREERHALARGALLRGLVRHIGAVLDELVYPAQRLGVVLERLVERLCEGRVCYVLRPTSLRTERMRARGERE